MIDMKPYQLERKLYIPLVTFYAQIKKIFVFATSENKVDADALLEMFRLNHFLIQKIGADIDDTMITNNEFLKETSKRSEEYLNGFGENKFYFNFVEKEKVFMKKMFFAKDLEHAKLIIKTIYGDFLEIVSAHGNTINYRLRNERE